MALSTKATKDGSFTLYNTELDEHYHSTHGAWQETNHVFIEAGLNRINKKHLRILEVGLGTGLNLMATRLHQRDQSIFYHGIESHPLRWAQIEALNYRDLVDKVAYEWFQKAMLASWDAPQQVDGTFELLKSSKPLMETVFADGYDLVYFDAFAPRVQPEMWSPEVFELLYGVLKPGACLVTYSSKGDVRRAMLAAGFEVEKLPGPPGKREMLRAIK